MDLFKQALDKTNNQPLPQCPHCSSELDPKVVVESGFSETAALAIVLEALAQGRIAFVVEGTQ